MNTVRLYLKEPYKLVIPCVFAPQRADVLESLLLERRIVRDLERGHGVLHPAGGERHRQEVLPLCDLPRYFIKFLSYFLQSSMLPIIHLAPNH